jgi:carbonic anhydrase
MESYKKLILNNKAWVHEKLEHKPNFFKDLSREQKPEFLWIGCSDSRVPAEEITGTQPGEIFVHRNIANLVVHTDFNLLSVLQFAVDFLNVKHIIVCGHYGCGGVKAAMSNSRFGLLNKWLRSIKDTYRIYRTELDMIVDQEKKTNRLVELNIIEQVHNLTKTSVVQRAWFKHKRPIIHGWVYGLDSGLIKELIMVPPETKIDPIYAYDFESESPLDT